jgi:peptidoglycan/xylan/chitin deacetylase (PgdA/CDA1 family)
VKRYAILVNEKNLDEYHKLNIGNHTKYHRNLFNSIDEHVLIEEIIHAQEEIKLNLGVDVNRFAFPNGQADQKSLEFVKNAGFKFNQLTNHSFHLKQNQVYYRIPPNCTSFEENIFKIHGFHERIRR